MIDRQPVTMALSALLASATNLPVGRGQDRPSMNRLWTPYPIGPVTS